MVYCHQIFIILSVFLHHWLITTAEETYFLGSQRFPQTYQQIQHGYNTQDFSPFRKTPQSFTSTSFNSDLETSDLSPHLQRRLPQYQFSLFENSRGQSNFQLHPPSSFESGSLSNHPSRFTQHISPSTHRPNYSHLFSRTSHNHDPSQTETFLGEITIQSPADLPAEFKNRNFGAFQPSIHFPVQQSNAYTNQNQTNTPKLKGETINQYRPQQPVDQNLDSTERTLTNNIQGSNRANFLNHRTRIFASESGNRPEINDYFVNSNGEVFVTTKKPDYFPESSEEVSTLPIRGRNKFAFSTEKHNAESTSEATTSSTQDTRTIENTFNLDSLLEEPVDKSKHSSNKDNVEVIQAVTLSPDKFYFPNPNATLENNDDDVSTSADDSQDLEEYDYDSTAIYDDETTTLNPDLEDVTENTEINTVEGNTNEKGGEKLNLTKETMYSKPEYDVVTMKPATMVKDDNFKKFIDSSVIDNNTDPPLKDTNGSQNLEDSVISVVTTKSIINNTIIGTFPSSENVTRQMSATTQSSISKNDQHTTDAHLNAQLSSPNQTGEEEMSTEGWVVVASVQTSRSVSGARYLPFSVVEQHERTKLLNERIEPEEDTTNTTTTVENETTTIMPNDKQNTSTESLTDKLDRVQSDLSGSLLIGSFNNEASNIAVITEGQLDKSDETTMFDSPSGSNVTNRPSTQASPPVIIRKFSPLARPTTTSRNKIGLKPRNQLSKINSPLDIDKPQNDQPLKFLVPEIKPKNGTTGRSSGISNQNQIIVQDVSQNKDSELSQKTLESVLSKIKFKETSALLPPGYHEKIASNNKTEKTVPPHDYNTPAKHTPITTESIFDSIKQGDISALLPPGYNSKAVGNNPSHALPKQNQNRPSDSRLNETNSAKDTPNKTDLFANLLKKTKQDNITALLPPGYKPPSEEKSKSKNNTLENIVKKSTVDDISAFLPPGYKPPNEESKNKSNTIENILKKTTADDISAFLPPGFKLPKSTTTKPLLSVFESAKKDDISAFLPPGYKPSNQKPDPIQKSSENETSTKSNSIKDLFENAKQDDLSAFLPAGYKSKFGSAKPSTTTTTTIEVSSTSENIKESTTPSSNFKLVFPSRPGGLHRKTNKPSASRPSSDQSVPANTPLSIHKGWPSRATTEFTGWPTPSTTPLTIEKILERARAAVGQTTSTTSSTITSTTTTTTTTTSTTTVRPTTPGLCVYECDLAGTIKLTGGVTWVPELLDRNTKEWQILANEVQYQLEEIYSKSDVLSKWYKKIQIDGFSEGSVLVDYLVKLNNVSRQMNTRDLKTLFHDALEEAFSKGGSNREAKSSDLGSPINENGKLVLGNFMVDPTFTDFVVLPKEILPTVGYAEDNVLLPQWAIAIIVIGLASLLFVIIFGVTVIVNKQKNAKKKQPSTLTEEMLNELNKNHMGGIDNYGADDLYNMEDVWNDKPYETKLPKKRSAGSLHDNSMPNIYDSWRSEWNGYYYNTYYGNHPGSSHSGYGRRRSDYDTNF